MVRQKREQRDRQACIHSPFVWGRPSFPASKLPDLPFVLIRWPTLILRTCLPIQKPEPSPSRGKRNPPNTQTKWWIYFALHSWTFNLMFVYNVSETSLSGTKRDKWRMHLRKGQILKAAVSRAMMWRPIKPNWGKAAQTKLQDWASCSNSS